MTVPRKTFIVLIAVLLLTAACARHAGTAAAPAPVPSPNATPAAIIAPELPKGRPAGSCKSVDGFPDPSCTPGVIDPAVTQGNIKKTICVKGYTKTVRPPVSYTDALKVQQISEYGYTDVNVRDYEEDHFVPLELGGNPRDPGNLWPELGPSPNPKDSVEGKLNRLVCSGKMSLAEAQTRIRTNWKTAVP